MTTIKQRHPVREAVSSHSSGSRYETPLQWWDKVVYELMDFGYFFQSEEMPTIHSLEGRGLLEIFDIDGKSTGCCLCYMWYCEAPGRNWEMVGYIT